MLDQISVVATYVNAGRVRALGVSTLTRSPLFPNIPTIDEAGVPGYQSMTYNGISAPANTPREVLGRLHAEIVRAAQDAEFKNRFLQQGIEASASALPEDFAAFVREDVARFAKLAREIGISARE